MFKKVTYDYFRGFLRSEGCEEAFDKNFEAAHPGYILDAGFARYIGIDCGVFGRVFHWADTPEGREYWKEIADRWWDRIK